MAPVRTSISLPASKAWVTAGADCDWAGEMEAARRTANSGKQRRIMLGLKIASASLLDKNQKRLPKSNKRARPCTPAPPWSEKKGMPFRHPPREDKFVLAA